jgi:hypothetical protein
MSSPRAKIALCVAVVVLSVASLYFTVLPTRPRHDLRAHEGLGRALAEQALKAGSGGKIVLIAPDTKTFPNPHTDAQVKALAAALKAAGNSIAATNLIKLDPLRLVRVPPGDFAQMLKKLSEQDVVVSLMGPPVLTPDMRSKLPQKLPRVIAVCAGDTPRQVPMKRLFDTGLIEAAVVSRNEGAASATASAQEAFSRAFKVVTAADVADLPAPAEGVL